MIYYDIKMAEDSSPVNSPDSFTENRLENILENAKKFGKTHLLQWLEVTVTEPEKRNNASMKVQDTFVVYLVETRITETDLKGFGQGTTSVWRRYSEFELLKNYLEITYSFVVVPPLPEKKPSYNWQNAATDKFNPDFVERRRAALEIFLLRVAAHSTLSQDKIFLEFLQREDGWKELVYSTDFQNKADSKIKSLSASYRLKKPDRRFEELKNYSNELQNNISNILKIRVPMDLWVEPGGPLTETLLLFAKLADRLYAIHKVHANYARVYGEWSCIEKEMSDGLQSAAHYMDVYSSTIDSILEEEEQFADQLKEYLFFADSLRSVCRKYECLQYDLEKVEDTLSSKSSQKEQLTQGKSAGFSLTSMKSKLFGNDTPEQREQKIKVLEEQIKESEWELKQVNEETQNFVDNALKDIDRFKRQKVKDLKEIFSNYAVMQIKECKKGIAIWTSAKDCFAKM